MNTPFVLAPEIKVISLRAKNTFRHLRLVLAGLKQGQVYPESTPCIEFTLLGERMKFTAYANRIPGSNVFNCFDLLEAAKEAMGEHDQLFDRVEIRALDKHYEGAYRIEGEMEVESH